MSSVMEASQLIRRVAGSRDVTDSIKAAIGRAALRLGWSYSRTKEIWYRNARRIDAHEIDQLRERAGRAEAELAIANLLALRERLAATDPHFHQPTIAALERALVGMGVPMGTVAVREE